MRLFAAVLTAVVAVPFTDQRKCETDWSQQVKDLRSEMQKYQINGYIIPSEDAHLSEYVAPEYARRAFISGLHGSAGEAVVLESGAALKTDSRYCESVKVEVDCNWNTFCPGSMKDLVNFVGEETKGQVDVKIGADPFLFTESSWKSYETELAKFDITLVAIEENLVDKVWSVDERPEPSTDDYFIHDIEYAGQSVDEKVKPILEKMKNKSASSLVVTRLDSIAWILNLRGLDIPFSPVIISYLVINSDGSAVMYPRGYEKINSIPGIQEHFCSSEVCVRVEDNYLTIGEHLKTLTGTVWVPATGTTFGVLNALDSKTTKLTDSCPVEYNKSVKNQVEQDGMRRSGLYDAVAISEALLNIETKLNNGDQLFEMDVVNDLIRLRGEVDGAHYKGESFGCISAAGPNAANNHYNPTEESNREIKRDETFLLDNGGQYLDGTTDVTRTLYIGTPPDEIKDSYTRVLQGNLHLANAQFPINTPGYQMEPFARQPLFQNHKKYGHGTGHGIGYFLLVHELPNGIGMRASSYNYAGFVPGMVESIEPGYYVSEEYGIRIEDDALVVDAGDGFIGFEKMSPVPYEPNLINFDLMTNEDMAMLREFHEQCRATADLAKELGRPETANWIKKRINKVIEMDEERNGCATLVFNTLTLLVISLFQ